MAIEWVGRPFGSGQLAPRGREWEELGVRCDSPLLRYVSKRGVIVPGPVLKVGRPEGVDRNLFGTGQLLGARRCELKFGRMGDLMKNTGKRIFAAVVLSLLVSLPLIAAAGLSVSQR